MNILAVDLTSPFGSLAVRCDGRIKASLDVNSTDGFAHLVFQAIHEVLQIAQLRPEDIDCFASATGPGAFTGVRVGLSVVKGLGDVFGRAVAGISNLRALSTFGSQEYRAPIMDARRGEVFCAVFDRAGNIVAPETVTKLSAWVEGLSGRMPEYIVQDMAVLDGSDSRTLPVTLAPRRLAGAIAECAEYDGQRELWTDPAVLDANYVRRSDAELFWRDSH